MKIFGVDTTRRKAKVFVVDSENRDIYMLEMAENVKHSEGLFLYIEKALLETKLNLNDFDAYSCIVGPGSFTGIRVGMSTIKGFCKAINKPIISINAFEVLSSKIKDGYILLNSTNTACYYAKIEKSNIVESGVVEKSQINDLAQGSPVVILDEEQDLMPQEYTNYRIVSELNSLYTDCVINKLNSAEYGEFVPFYLQLSQAERNLKHE